MAKSSSQYSILVGVQLQTGDIRKQLEEASKGLKVTIDTKTGQVAFKDLTSSAKSANDTIKQTGETAKKVGEQIRQSGDDTRSASDSMRDAELSFQAANEVFQTTIDIMSSMVDQVFELDTALTEFKKVSDLSGDSLDSYVDKLSEMGNSVGRTGSEMVDAATQFRKNGFNDEDAAQLGQVAATFQNVSDKEIDAGESASFIIAQMTAFGDELSRFGSSAEQASHVIDVVNEISNQYSVSSADLAENLGNMSAALAVGNNSMEESIALLTAGTEITRSASKTSRALVSVQSRYNQIIDETSSTGKALLEWYKEHDITIIDQQGQLLSLFDVLGQVANKWDTLSKNEQTYYLNQQAGRNAFIGLIDGDFLRALYTKLL